MENEQWTFDAPPFHLGPQLDAIKAETRNNRRLARQRRRRIRRERDDPTYIARPTRRQEPNSPSDARQTRSTTAQQKKDFQICAIVNSPAFKLRFQPCASSDNLTPYATFTKCVCDYFLCKNCISKCKICAKNQGPEIIVVD